MLKIKLIPDPTFKAKVGVHVAGHGKVDVELTYKYRGLQESLAFIRKADGLAPFKPLFIWRLVRRLRKDWRGATTTESLMLVCEGWDLEDEFNERNIERLVDIYPSFINDALKTYFSELYGAREKNL